MDTNSALTLGQRHLTPGWRRSHDSQGYETIPSIEAEESEARPLKTATPLPWKQFSLAVAIPFCDSLANQSTKPFINKLVSELDIIQGDKRKVGYYIGLMGSLTAAALTISVLPLNRLSDRIGRKPILLLGLSVALMSILWVGLAKTFWSLAASQCFRGLFDGNISVSKNVIGEMTDYTNRSRAFSLFLILSTCGRTLGLLIGGDLQKRSSSLFGIEFFKQHPYFLPCLVVAIILAIAFIVILFFLEETAPRRVLGRQSLQEESSQTYSPPLRELAVYPVIIAVANYTGLVFLNQCENALLPLVFAMPVEIGGLGFNPAQIGYILGAYSLLTTFFLAFFFGPIIRFFGERRFFIFCVFSQLLMWVMLPIIHQYARHFGIGAHVWVGLAVMSLPHVCVEMGFGCIYTYLIGAAPNRRSMSSTIAVAYVISSIFGIMVPTMATSLFSYSIQHNILGGYAVYAVISFWTVLATLVAFCLPFDARPVWERERS